MGYIAPGAPRVRCLEDLGVGIAQLDGNVALQLVLEAHGLHPGDGLHHCRLPVGHVANGTCPTVRQPSLSDRQTAQPVNLKRTVWIPEMAFTTVDFVRATCPMVPVRQTAQLV